MGWLSPFCLSGQLHYLPTFAVTRGRRWTRTTAHLLPTGESSAMRLRTKHSPYSRNAGCTIYQLFLPFARVLSSQTTRASFKPFFYLKLWTNIAARLPPFLWMWVYDIILPFLCSALGGSAVEVKTANHHHPHFVPRQRNPRLSFALLLVVAVVP